MHLSKETTSNIFFDKAKTITVRYGKKVKRSKTSDDLASNLSSAMVPAGVECTIILKYS